MMRLAVAAAFFAVGLLTAAPPALAGDAKSCVRVDRTDRGIRLTNNCDGPVYAFACHMGSGSQRCRAGVKGKSYYTQGKQMSLHGQSWELSGSQWRGGSFAHGACDGNEMTTIFPRDGSADYSCGSVTLERASLRCADGTTSDFAYFATLSGSKKQVLVEFDLGNGTRAKGNFDAATYRAPKQGMRGKDLDQLRGLVCRGPAREPGLNDFLKGKLREHAKESRERAIAECSKTQPLTKECRETIYGKPNVGTGTMLNGGGTRRQ
jgi:hypothetical protein